MTIESIVEQAVLLRKKLDELDQVVADYNNSKSEVSKKVLLRAAESYALSIRFINGESELTPKVSLCKGNPNANA